MEVEALPTEEAAVRRYGELGRHRYVFRLYALDAEPELAAGAAKAELEQAIGATC